MNPAICDPASFGQAPAEFYAQIDTAEGPMTVKVLPVDSSALIFIFLSTELLVIHGVSPTPGCACLGAA